MIKRIKTGIPGLDGLLNGGFLQGSVNLVTGSTGCGKTIFALQYLWEGLKKGETGVYITLEESPEDIKLDASEFGWDFEAFEKKGLCKIIYHDPAQVNNLSSVIMDEISTMKAKRLVIDSVSVMGLVIADASQIRRRIMGIVSAIKRSGLESAVVTCELVEGSKQLSRFGVEEFAVDCVVVLHYLGIGERFNRTLAVRKMRRSDHGKDIYPFEISAKGIVVQKSDL